MSRCGVTTANARAMAAEFLTRASHRRALRARSGQDLGRWPPPLRTQPENTVRRGFAWRDRRFEALMRTGRRFTPPLHAATATFLCCAMTAPATAAWSAVMWLMQARIGCCGVASCVLTRAQHVLLQTLSACLARCRTDTRRSSTRWPPTRCLAPAPCCGRVLRAQRTVRNDAARLTCAFAARAQEAVLQFNSRTKVDAVRQKVETVKNTMSSNIDKVR